MSEESEQRESEQRFAIARIETGDLNALVKNIMAQTGEKNPGAAVRLVNASAWILTRPNRRWFELDGAVHLVVRSDGMSGLGWAVRSRTEPYSKVIISGPFFKPTTGKTKEIVILRRKLFIAPINTKNIFMEAQRRHLNRPIPEDACLVMSQFSREEILDMGFTYIDVPHEPIDNFDGVPNILGINCCQDNHHLDACHPDHMSGSGFAFVV